MPFMSSNGTCSDYCRPNSFRTNPNLSVAQVQRYQAEAETLSAVLAAGRTGVDSGGGKQVTYDLIAVRKRLRDLNQILYPARRPRISTVYLGGF